jgi:hypothetical protein
MIFFMCTARVHPLSGSQETKEESEAGETVKSRSEIVGLPGAIKHPSEPFISRV